MKIAVTGSGGFLGSRFIELYSKKYKQVKQLTSVNAPLQDLKKIVKETKGIDILVHFAFDHYYENNIKGIKNILQACEINNIKKIIHISTVSVYDPYIQGELNEKCGCSVLNDPYAKEKIRIEKIIQNHKNTKLHAILLQPTIVYGIGGNWTNYAFQVVKSRGIVLPKDGQGFCNVVYVDDVAQSVYKASISGVEKGKFLISGNESITWEDFYDGHARLLEQSGFTYNFSIIEEKHTNDFSSNRLKHIIFVLWYKTFLGNILNLFIKVIKKYREKQFVKKNTKEKLITFLKSKVSEKVIKPIGITKQVHNSNFKVSISKAKKILDYQPNYDVRDAFVEMKNELSKIR